MTQQRCNEKGERSAFFAIDVQGKNIAILNKIKFVCFAVYIVVGILRSTNVDFPGWTSFSQIIQFFFLFLTFAIVLYQSIRRQIKFKWIGVILVATGLLSLWFSRHTFMLSFAVFFCAFATMDFKEALKKYLIVLSITLGFVVVLSLFNIIEMGGADRGAGISRINFGFKTATLPNTIFFFICLGFVYLKKQKTPWLALLFFVATASLLYHFTNTRTGFFLTIASCIGCALDKLFNLQKVFKKMAGSKFWLVLFTSLPILFLALDFGLIKYYSTMSEMAFTLNRFFSTRLSLSLNLIQKEGFSLFGKNIPSHINGEYYQSDICYIYYGINYGLVSLFLTLFLESLCFYRAFKTKDMWLCTAIVFVLIDGIFEPYLLDIKYQIFPFVLSSYLLGKKTKVWLPLSILHSNERSIQICLK